ncbi:MAG: GNAT family N-acetyltransferase [Shimia sp.]
MSDPSGYRPFAPGDLTGLGLRAGPGLVLRPLTAADVTPAYLSWFRDPEVTRHLEARDLTRDDVVPYIENGHASGLHVMFGLFVEGGTRHVGNCKLGPIAPHHGLSGVVTVLGDRAAWGRGLARCAVVAVTAWAFEARGLRKLSDGVTGGNDGSTRAYVAAGWHVEGRLRDQYLVDGTPHDRVAIAAFHPNHPTLGWRRPAWAVGAGW